MKSDTTIFYSWQSDNPATKRFIDKSLRQSIKELADNTELDVSPRLDKDTQGEVGSPNIVSVVKSKIDKCGIFVADISIVDESVAGKKLVNQNVMFELGYATARRDDANVLLLFNADLGKPTDLPFDISHHRVLQFSMKDDEKGVQLKDKLIGALTAHLSSLMNQEVAEIESELDEIQLLIMKIFAGMEDKRIMVSSHMGGSDIYLVDAIDKVLKDELDALDSQEVIANLEDMTNIGLLSVHYGSNGTPNFKPTKAGFDIIKILNKKS